MLDDQKKSQVIDALLDKLKGEFNGKALEGLQPKPAPEEDELGDLLGAELPADDGMEMPPGEDEEEGGDLPPEVAELLQLLMQKKG